ncbi:tyrosine-type recombinase/integrase [Bradyrhizobium sp. NBAIM01]|uniref:tyrosine-type recombinase/integrase n=1 Tax=Bradyrhizobium sp. NBAIM01 TaxID=2793818 RepID=UPI001CD698DA|nr:tyrosine-type recombinase/integrase [Bradyrhizobium sp. NBAIM01]MCA1515647.1 tyrosine-type recombinase/integrase [Bradyrhizobium sp. NBAIM01]
MNQLAKSACNNMRRTVAAQGHGGGMYSFSLYGPEGGRKYLNRDERRPSLSAMEALEPDDRLLALTLACTVMRISEVLSIVPLSFQVGACIVAVLTLKSRSVVWREIPIPRWLMAELDSHFDIAEAQRDPVRSRQRLWPQHRVTGWRAIKQVMMFSQIVGRAACPRGLRHSFGVGTLKAGAPLSMVQRWLGHSRMSTTAIYTAACGPEEVAFIKGFWRDAGLDRRPDDAAGQ